MMYIKAFFGMLYLFTALPFAFIAAIIYGLYLSLKEDLKWL